MDKKRELYDFIDREVAPEHGHKLIEGDVIAKTTDEHWSEHKRLLPADLVQYFRYYLECGANIEVVLENEYLKSESDIDHITDYQCPVPIGHVLRGYKVLKNGLIMVDETKIGVKYDNKLGLMVTGGEEEERDDNDALTATHLIAGPVSLITINNGPDIKESNYWDTEWAAKGIEMCSVNGGALRILVPDNELKKFGGEQKLIEELNTAKEVLVLKGRGPSMGSDMACYRFVFDDHTDRPFFMQIGANQMERQIGERDNYRKLTVSVWVRGPRKIYENREATFEIKDNVERY